MAKINKLNKKGFGYIVAIGMLGLLAFMGLFLMQSSSAEYSQTAISVYRTMGRQLAEAAADEAAAILEERFKDKTSSGFFQQLLWQASTSGPMRTGGKTGLNPSFLNDFTDLHTKVSQTLALKNYHISRAGFVIEKVLPTLKDLRPIPQGPLDFDSCYYRPTDREYSFDDQYSKDWYCTLQLDVTVSLQKQKKFSINYQISRDIKIINVGPIARNYSFYSILGVFAAEYANPDATLNAIRNVLNDNPDKEKGRLFIWNHPFQSRVFLHGPAIINLENPNLKADPTNFGAYNYPPKNEGPGPSMAYQYRDTFYGFSYFPDASRCLFPKKSFWQIWFGGSTATKEDQANFIFDGKPLLEKSTVKGGFFPESDKSLWEGLKDLFSEGVNDTYFTGTNYHQKFLPAGPFCRAPSRFVSKTPEHAFKGYANAKADPTSLSFPNPEPNIKIEHRWDPNNDEVAKNSKIYSRVYAVKYNQLTGNIGTPEEKTSEFTLNYYNNPDSEGFFSKAWDSLVSVGGQMLNVITLPVQGVVSLATPLIKKLFNLGGGDAIIADEEKVFANLFPTNFKYLPMSVATRRLKNETEIPLDSEGNWVLNGVYWLDSLNIEDDVQYVGTGTLLVSRYVKDKPLTIKGSVVAKRINKVPQGHLTIIYNPVESYRNLYNALASNDFNDRMLTLDGGVIVEASVYSVCGIKSINGLNIEMADFPTKYHMDPEKPLQEWGGSLDSVLKAGVNAIYGNYVNYYITLNKQEDDLWVVHNTDNPFMFYRVNNFPILIQDDLDNDDENKTKRKAYEYKTHDFFMSPKIQHIGIRGSL